MRPEYLASLRAKAEASKVEQAERESVALKLRKLLALTPERGATEAEATAALLAAQRLMAVHGFSVRDIQAAEHGGWTHASAWIAPEDGIEIACIIPAVMSLFKVQGWTHHPDPSSDLVDARFFGHPVAVEVACWAYGYLRGTYQDLWTRYRSVTRCRKSKRRAYYLGLSQGLLARHREESPPPEAREVAYKARLSAAFDDEFGAMPALRHPGGAKDRAVVRDGREVGGSINLDRPLGDGPRLALPGPDDGGVDA